MAGQNHHDHGFRILLSVTWELFSFLEVSPSAGIRERRDWRLVLTALLIAAWGTIIAAALIIAAWGTITAAALIIAAWWPVAAFITIACCCVAALGRPVALVAVVAAGWSVVVVVVVVVWRSVALAVVAVARRSVTLVVAVSWLLVALVMAWGAFLLPVKQAARQKP